MKQLTVGLIGNPNSGKTTLFNALTGAHQMVGNWPRVTVERKSGYFESENHHVQIVDLPGIYSLSVTSEEGALDERIAAEYMLSSNANLIINVLDANNLERNLYLTTQLLELDIPVILAVNMLDIAKKRGITIDIDKLFRIFNCPVVGLVASKMEGVNELKRNIISTFNKPQKKRLPFTYQMEIDQAIKNLISEIKTKNSYFLAVRLLEDDVLAKQKVSARVLELAQQYKQTISSKLHEDVDILIADTRYGMIHELIKQVVTESVHLKTTLTAAIDKIVLNRALGIPIFLALMYLMFLFAVNVGGILQDYFQIWSNAIFVHGFANLLSNLHTPNWLTAILTSGLGKGINTVITFIPVLATMFIFLALLESTGYMSRAGFVVDRVMTAIGLPGKSFVPMLIGFGCNVPAIMAARTLENMRDRILTIMMTPFMSCTARLAIYAVFTAAFFPKGRQNIVFALYLAGIVIAVITGLILRKTLLVGRQSTLVTELPPYHLPTVTGITMQAWCRLKMFICKAGKVIIPACVIIGALNTITIDSKHSLLATAGREITPILKPMGIQQDNWPATVGLMAGVVAKEVVVATLNTLYAVDSYSVSNKYQGLYGQMYKRFDGQIGAFAYLLFVLLYFPCIPALATIFHELGWRWATFSMFWNTGVAYGTATLFYQAATFNEHPKYATISIIIVLMIFLSVVLTMRWISKKSNRMEI
ncbi:MAG: hypothetical protein AMJ43_01570 [Coxiella sp. DG_40]|nr:MAG: hypothetical protein AMJ43_01570 [Coxiella sp. DG_40]